MGILIKPISEGSFLQVLKVMEAVMMLSFQFKRSLRNVLYETSYKRGERILNFGETQPVAWFMLSGLLREIRMSKVTLKEKTGWYWLPDSFVYTDPGFFSQEPSVRAVEAEVGCDLVMITYADWLALKAKFQEVETIMEIMRGRHSKIRIEHIEDMKSLSVDERYLDLEDVLDYLFPRTQLNFIADFMGMAPATLGRLRTRYYGRRK